MTTFELREPVAGCDVAEMYEVLHGKDGRTNKEHIKVTLRFGTYGPDGTFIHEPAVKLPPRWVRGPELEAFYDSVPSRKRGQYRHEDLAKWLNHRGVRESPHRVDNDRAGNIDVRPVSDQPDPFEETLLEKMKRILNKRVI